MFNKKTINLIFLTFTLSSPIFKINSMNQFNHSWLNNDEHQDLSTYLSQQPIIENENFSDDQSQINSMNQFDHLWLTDEDQYLSTYLSQQPTIENENLYDDQSQINFMNQFDDPFFNNDEDQDLSTYLSQHPIIENENPYDNQPVNNQLLNPEILNNYNIFSLFKQFNDLKIESNSYNNKIYKKYISFLKDNNIQNKFQKNFSQILNNFLITKLHKSIIKNSDINKITAIYDLLYSNTKINNESINNQSINNQIFESFKKTIAEKPNLFQGDPLQIACELENIQLVKYFILDRNISPKKYDPTLKSLPYISNNIDVLDFIMQSCSYTKKEKMDYYLKQAKISAATNNNTENIDKIIQTILTIKEEIKDDTAKDDILTSIITNAFMNRKWTTIEHLIKTYNIKLNSINSNFKFDTKSLFDTGIVNILKHIEKNNLELNYLIDENKSNLIEGIIKNPIIISSIISKYPGLTQIIDKKSNTLLHKIINGEINKIDNKNTVFLLNFIKKIACHIEILKNAPGIFVNKNITPEEMNRFCNNLVNTALTFFLINSLPNNSGLNDLSLKNFNFNDLSLIILSFGYECFENPKNNKIIKLLREKQIKQNEIAITSSSSKSKKRRLNNSNNFIKPLNKDIQDE